MPVAVHTDTVTLPNKEAEAQMLDLWRAINEQGHIAQREAVALASEKKEVEIVLDSTTYHISLTQAQISLDVDVPGPDPNAAYNESQVPPLSKWSLGLVKLLNQRLQKEAGIP